MDKIIITQREQENDGKTVYLYFNDDIGFYTAYGCSAFLVSHLVDPVKSFSKEMQMPVVLVNKLQVLELRRSLKKMEHIEHNFYKFSLRAPIGKEGYSKWTENLQN